MASSRPLGQRLFVLAVEVGGRWKSVKLATTMCAATMPTFWAALSALSPITQAQVDSRVFPPFVLTGDCPINFLGIRFFFSLGVFRLQESATATLVLLLRQHVAPS